METPSYSLARREPRTLSRRDVVRPVFRYRRLGLGLFLSLTLVLATIALFWPARYEAALKILVKRERADPVLSADRDPGSPGRLVVSDSEVYSEVELLKSRDLLAAVVKEAGLVAPVEGKTIDQVALAQAVRTLESRLTVAPARKTTVIEVSYWARDPQQAARVLTVLSQRYLEKHLEVHRPEGSREFFADQTERLRAELTAAQTRLVEFGRQHQVVSAAVEKDSSLQQLAAFEATGAQVRAQVADVNRRLAVLRQQESATPPRQTTALRTAGQRRADPRAENESTRPGHTAERDGRKVRGDLSAARRARAEPRAGAQGALGGRNHAASRGNDRPEPDTSMDPG